MTDGEKAAMLRRVSLSERALEFFATQWALSSDPSPGELEGVLEEADELAKADLAPGKGHTPAPS